MDARYKALLLLHTQVMGRKERELVAPQRAVCRGVVQPWWVVDQLASQQAEKGWLRPTLDLRKAS